MSLPAHNRSSAEATYELALLQRSEAKWRESTGLRVVYRDMFARMKAVAAEGPALELGSGIGRLRSVIPDVVTSDIVKTPYVEIAASAYAIEATRREWMTIYAMDVLHHLREPWRFFASAARSLPVRGRVVLMEPAATPLGRLFYRSFHPEPIRPETITPPYEFPADDAAGNFANMGMGWALFVRDQDAVIERLSSLGLGLRSVTFSDGLAYASTGGLSRPQLLPTRMLRRVLRAEKWLPQTWWRRAGLRMLIVLERVPADSEWRG